MSLNIVMTGFAGTVWAGLLKDICEDTAGQTAVVGVAHKSLHQRLIERLFGKRPQLLQPVRTLMYFVSFFSAKDTFFFFLRPLFIFCGTVRLQRDLPRDVNTWSAHSQTLWCWQERLLPQPARSLTSLNGSSGMNWVAPDWLKIDVIIIQDTLEGANNCLYTIYIYIYKYK